MTIDPLMPHRHDNNETPPTASTDILVTRPDGTSLVVTVAQLQADFPTAVIPRYQFSTDHGVHGPYRLAGVALADFATA
ncbi:MAG: hypothetical protein KDD89_15105, partial [Anaerolineales bacterium]|nr:hypothetical protein [Anaerolineales bacterium]